MSRDLGLENLLVKISIGISEKGVFFDYMVLSALCNKLNYMASYYTLPQQNTLYPQRSFNFKIRSFKFVFEISATYWGKGYFAAVGTFGRSYK